MARDQVREDVERLLGEARQLRKSAETASPGEAKPKLELAQKKEDQALQMALRHEGLRDGIKKQIREWTAKGVNSGGEE